MGQFSRRELPALALALVASTGCGDDVRLGLGGEPPPNNFDCSIPIDQIASGALRDAIPALTNPALVPFDDPGAAYLVDHDRVISLEINNFRVAVPLNVLWWHEIVNLEIGLVSVAVTHCPLTGSSLVFDRGPLGGVEFGVSGLLYQTNLMMYDRVNEDSLSPQLARGARCGPKTGQELKMLPAIEMRWDEFKGLQSSAPERQSLLMRGKHTYNHGLPGTGLLGSHCGEEMSYENEARWNDPCDRLWADDHPCLRWGPSFFWISRSSG